jgi:KaiC/GvpD/RAD55 family RecA-like ATPase
MFYVLISGAMSVGQSLIALTLLVASCHGASPCWIVSTQTSKYLAASLTLYKRYVKQIVLVGFLRL